MSGVKSFLKKFDIENFEKILSQKVFNIDLSMFLVGVAIGVYTITFSYLTIMKYYGFRTYAWDLGIFTQSLWTTLSGQGFFYHTPELFVNPSGSFFGVHFSPILFLVLPFYWIMPTPETLLVLQSFILALAAVPIYKLAKENAGGRIVGLTFAFAYLMFPAVHFVNWYDFHVQVFLPLFFTCIIYYVMKGDWPKYFLFVFLALMCEEHVALIIFFVGIYIAWRYRVSILSTIRGEKTAEKKLLIPFITMIISIVWYWFTIWQRNTFFPINPEAMGEFLGSANFSILGARDPLEIPLLIVLRPWNAVQALAYDGHIKLLYVALLFGPLAFFSFKAPSALIPTIPWFGMSFISQTLCHHMLGHQYEAYVVSFIFVAAIFALKKNYSKKSELKHITGSVQKIVVSSLIFFVVVSPLCPVIRFLFPDYTSIYIGEHERLLSEVVNMVRPNASIMTQNNLFTHFSHRINAYIVPDRFLGTGIHDIAVDFVNVTLDKVEWVLVDNKTDPIATALVLSLLETKPQFTLIASRDNGTILLYWRKP